MNRRVAGFCFKAKAVLCVGLILTQTYLAGCGSNRLNLPVTAAMFQLRLDKDHELSRALEETTFKDASGFEVYPAEQKFALTFRDDGRQVWGSYAFVNGEFTITGFAFTRNGETAVLDFSEAKQITRIATSDGLEWTRPPETTARAVPAAGAQGVDAYLAANADILEYAKGLDQQLADGKAPPGKTNTALLPLLAGVLFVTAALWAPLALTLQVLFTIFVVSVILQNVMVFRFDGNWSATNAGGTLTLSIQSGRITRLIDQSSGTELPIVQSDLQTVAGTNVTWNVSADVAGVNVPVEFEFEMQETATGELTGFLTATGNTLGRGPVTMTRITT